MCLYEKFISLSVLLGWFLLGFKKETRFVKPILVTTIYYKLCQLKKMLVTLCRILR